jgi:hypothetical protein
MHEESMNLPQREIVASLTQAYAQETGVTLPCTYLRWFDVPTGERVLVHIPVVRQTTAAGTLTIRKHVRGWALATDRFQTLHGQNCRLFRFLPPVSESLAEVWLTDDPLD